MIAPPTNVLCRTFFIRAASYGTAFTLEVDGIEYLVTARHLFDTESTEHSVSVHVNNSLTKLDILQLEFGRGQADIAVLRVRQRLSPKGMDLEPTVANMTLGQDVFILGFPEQMYEDVGRHMNGFPCPLVKRGTAANLAMRDPQELLVDVRSNLGFSGGPVVFSPLDNPKIFRVAGVISGFKLSREAVKDKEGNDTGMYVEVNSGFLLAYGIKHAMTIIERMAANQNSATSL